MLTLNKAPMLKQPTTLPPGGSRPGLKAPAAWALAILALFVLLYVSLPFLFKAAGVQALLESELRKVFQGSLDFKEVDLNTFPRLALEVQAPVLKQEFGGGYAMMLRGKVLRATPRIFPLLFRAVIFRSIVLADGKLYVWTPERERTGPPSFALSDADARISEFRLPASGSFSLKGRLADSKSRNLSLKGRFEHRQVKRAGGAVPRLRLALEARASDADLGQLIDLIPEANRPPLAGRGDLAIDVETRPDYKLEGTVSLEAKDVLLREGNRGMKSLGPLEGEFRASYLPDEERLQVKDFALTSSWAKLQASSELAFKEPAGSSELEVSLDVMRLDTETLTALAGWGAGLAAKGPLSGHLFLAGPLEKLRVKGDIVASAASLAFLDGAEARESESGQAVFLKPQGTVFETDYDLLLEAGSHLSGELNARLGEITAKGSIPKCDVRTGVGELTILTNKFSLEPIASWIPPLAAVSLGGEIKILINLRGPWGTPAELRREMNVTLEGVSVASQGAKLVDGISGVLDASSVGFSLEKAQLHFPGEPVMWGEARYDAPSGGQLEVHFENQVSRVYVRGAVPMAARAPAGAAFELKGIPLGPLTSVGRTQPILDGRFFASGVWKSAGGSIDDLLANSTAEGTFLIWKGKIYVLDLLGELGSVGKLVALTPYADGTTTFERLESPFRLDAQTLRLTDLRLTSSRLNGQGVAEIAWKGWIEADAHLFLADDLVRRAVGDSIADARLTLPLHVSGPVSAPEVRIDRGALERSLGTLILQRFGALQEKIPPGLSGAVSGGAGQGAGSTSPSAPVDPTEPSTAVSDLLDTGLQVLDAILASEKDNSKS